MAKISINQNECLGCGFCASQAPEIFIVDEKDFKAKIKIDNSLSDTTERELSAEELEKVKRAVEDCPIKAITISEN